MRASLVVAMLGIGGVAHAQPPSMEAQLRCGVDATASLVALAELDAAIAAATPPARDRVVRASRRADVGGASQRVAVAVQQIERVLTVEPMVDECMRPPARTPSAAERASLVRLQRAWEQFEHHRRTHNFDGARRIAALRVAATEAATLCVAAVLAQHPSP